jgi:hypothetical protein
MVYSVLAPQLLAGRSAFCVLNADLSYLLIGQLGLVLTHAVC